MLQSERPWTRVSTTNSLEPPGIDESLHERDVGMDKDDAIAAAERDEIIEIRVISTPLPQAIRLDDIPSRLNLAVPEDRAIRAAFF